MYKRFWLYDVTLPFGVVWEKQLLQQRSAHLPTPAS